MTVHKLKINVQLPGIWIKRIQILKRILHFRKYAAIIYY